MLGRNKDGKPITFAPNFSASRFKQGLRDAFEKHTTFLPESATFISSTGQWCKPILRKVLLHPIRTMLYLADPQTAAGERGQPLSTYEFLWSLPTALELTEGSKASLEVRIYSPELRPDRIAFFPDCLVARNVPLSAPVPVHLRGHPAFAGPAPVWQGPQTVNVWLKGDVGFNNATETCSRAVARVSEASKPCLSWSAADGFKFDPLFRFNFRTSA
ncbi:MAG TPA: hypothetical protein VD997_00755 [Phycisphaerales bacterium]|nr:hypothetical protein [Phycisphaerales bacterium]